MIPTIEDILNGYKSGTYTLDQCIRWLERHKVLSTQEALSKLTEAKRD